MNKDTFDKIVELMKGDTSYNDGYNSGRAAGIQVALDSIYELFEESRLTEEQWRMITKKIKVAAVTTKYA